MLNAEDIKRMREFVRAFKAKRPNSPIIKGVKDEAGEAIHLTVDDLEALIKAARNMLPLSEAMKLHEVQLWTYDPASQRVVREDWKQAELG